MGGTAQLPEENNTIFCEIVHFETETDNLENEKTTILSHGLGTLVGIKENMVGLLNDKHLKALERESRSTAEW